MAETDETPTVSKAKRPETGRGSTGRAKGTPNKVSASAKENVIAVFTRLGSTAAMARWAKKNQTEFYRLYAKLLPREITGSLDLPMTVVFKDAIAQRPADYERERGHLNG